LTTLVQSPVSKNLLFKSCTLPDLNARLADMGMIPGTIWKLIQKVPFSGPLILSNGETRISVRKADAEKIFVDPA
jgi:Fe2+ transport system protein FeoA